MPDSIYDQHGYRRKSWLSEIFDQAISIQQSWQKAWAQVIRMGR